MKNLLVFESFSKNKSIEDTILGIYDICQSFDDIENGEIVLSGSDDNDIEDLYYNELSNRRLVEFKRAIEYINNHLEIEFKSIIIQITISENKGDFDNELEEFEQPIFKSLTDDLSKIIEKYFDFFIKTNGSDSRGFFLQARLDEI